ncbi:Cupin domain-containing protein [Formivibrio citricus]|uniref:Cupin domain-containing protein n=1 Tax=Formivibrio citricus TaxID=83765 RepID=A0A1I5A5M4_9NEIS|nr:cupin domain-containing protein [Formivibrio citricus]SFN57753.1 Cupin domain-containing protein [Formivibrio citricus]
MHIKTVAGRSSKKACYLTQRLMVGALLLASLSTAALASDQGYYPVQELLVTGETVAGEKIKYPTTGAPKITVAVVTVAPNSQAGFHRHPVPLVAYILEGELTVDYGEKGVKTFRKGDAVVEAMNLPHRGMNLGSGVVKLLAVYVGAEGSANATLEK